MIFGLRLTQRCLHEDLRYPDPVSDFKVAIEHRIVRDFLHLRREQPEGSEGAIASLRAPFMKLKSGERERGVTVWERTPQGRRIHDEALPYEGVVWLAGVGYRKEGDKDDAYEMFARIGAARLRPVLLDYELLYADIHLAAEEALKTDLEKVMHELLERAWREPGRLHQEHVEIGELAVGISVFDYAEYRVAILPLLDDRNHAVPEDILMLLVRAVFGDECDLAQLVDQVDPRILGEMGYRPRPRDWVLADIRKRP